MLWMHSGLQFGGLPMKPSMQAQTDCPFEALHMLFGPHGLGSHGLLIGTEKKTVVDINLYIMFNIWMCLLYDVQLTQASPERNRRILLLFICMYDLIVCMCYNNNYTYL